MPRDDEYAKKVFEIAFEQGKEEGKKVGFSDGVITTLTLLKIIFEMENTKWGRKAAKACLEICDHYVESKNENV